jgi:DUF1009 family protein
MYDDITLTPRQINYLMEKFDAQDPDTAFDRFIEFLVSQGKNVMEAKEHLNRMMARENN